MTATTRTNGGRALGILLAAVGVVACGDARTGSRGGAAGVEVRDSAGVRIVINHVSGEDVPVGVDEVLRIGVVEGDDHYMFSRIAGVAFDRDGSLYVANNGSNSIRVYSPAGEYVRDIGRRGQGPGEFRGMYALFVTGDSVAALDGFRGNRAILYTRAGTLLGDWNLVRMSGEQFSALALLSTGWMGVSTDPQAVPIRLPPGQQTSVTWTLRMIDPEQDSTGPPIIQLHGVTLRATRTGELVWDLFRFPIGLPAIGPDGSIHRPAEDEYRIDVFDRTGRPTMVVMRDHQPIEITQADVDEILARADAAMDTATMLFGLDREFVRNRTLDRIRERARLFPTGLLAPIRRVLAMPAGGFWVERLDACSPAQASSDLDGAEFPAFITDHPTRWDVFGPDGVFRFAVDLPARFAPLAVTGSSATGVIRDELDVEYVVTYRVRGP